MDTKHIVYIGDRKLVVFMNEHKDIVAVEYCGISILDILDYFVPEEYLTATITNMIKETEE
jgi:hypothetical protein